MTASPPRSAIVKGELQYRREAIVIAEGERDRLTGRGAGKAKQAGRRQQLLDATTEPGRLQKISKDFSAVWGGGRMRPYAHRP
jgi:hypothetical protein